MRVLQYPAFDQLEIRDLDVTPPQPDEVRLKVAACGICGSELESFKNHSPRRPPPLVMGHEFCGTVAELGVDVRDVKKGARVVSNSLVPCGTCVRCRRGDTHLCATRQIFGMHRPGAFAEYVNVPARCLIPWPENLPAEAAALAEPLANGIHIVNLTKNYPAATVLVIGAGPIGLFTQQALQVLRGSKVYVADLSPERLVVAKKLGAAGVINSREQDPAKVMQELTAGEGADLVIDAVGASVTKKTSLDALRPGGVTVWIGLHEAESSLDINDAIRREIVCYGSFAYTHLDFAAALRALEQKRLWLNPPWTRVEPLERGAACFEELLGGSAVAKIWLTP